VLTILSRRSVRDVIVRRIASLWDWTHDVSHKRTFRLPLHFPYL
jgi:hypothetical protein